MFRFKRMAFPALNLIIAAIMSANVAYTQQGPARGRIEKLRDTEMEATAKHNLEVARWYIIRRKAYAGARERLQEIIDTYPEYSRMDEVVYWMGEAHARLSKTDKAIEYFNKLIKEYPDSEFVKKAKARVDELKSESPPKNDKETEKGK